MDDTSAHNRIPNNISGFQMFLTKVNRYKERYDMLLERKLYDKYDVSLADYEYGEVNRYKIYDKYIYSESKTPLRKNLNAKEATYIVKLMNDDELLYLRQIYDYCYSGVTKEEWLIRLEPIPAKILSQKTSAFRF